MQTKFIKYATTEIIGRETTTRPKNVSLSVLKKGNHQQVALRCRFQQSTTFFHNGKVDLSIKFRNDTIITLKGKYEEKRLSYCARISDNVDATFYFELPNDIAENLKIYTLPVSKIRLSATYKSFLNNETTGNEAIDFEPDNGNELLLSSQLKCLK